MRLLGLVAALILLRAPAARAGAILYATAATENRVDGFCIRGDGSLAPTPATQVGTAGTQPRRLVVGTNGVWTVLYVMEVDRVEAFRIGRRGGLSRIGATPTFDHPHGNPLDAALSPDATKLYVPENGRDRLVAYPLDPTTGAPGADFTSCIKGPKASKYQRLVVANGFLYVTDVSLGGRISVFPLAADGSLPEEASVCQNAKKSKAEPTCPCSERRKMDRPRAFLVDGDTIYVESLLKKRIIEFTLHSGQTTDQSGGPNEQKGCPAVADHQFEKPIHKKDGKEVPVCLKDDSTGNALKGGFKWQAWTSATKVDFEYEDMVRIGDTLLGSQFLKARIDAFRLKDDGMVPKAFTSTTAADVRGSPVGLTTRGQVLYVGGGELDRVQAYRVGPNSGLPEPTPFSQTDELTNSFPNALVTADVPDSCE